MSLNSNKNNLVLLSVITIISAVVWVYILNITYNKISKLHSIKTGQDQQKNKNQQIAEIKNQFLQHNTSIDDVLSILPSNDNFLSFIKFLESTAIANNTTINIDFDNSDEKGAKVQSQSKPIKDNKVDFMLELNGNKNDLINTISQIEKGKYFIDFKTINYISRSDDNSLATAKSQGVVYVKNNFEE